MVLILKPYGEFPLNDDWMYARSVNTLHITGRYWVCDFQAVTAFIQILWGTLFSKIFGFSMWTLRLSVLILGWGGILASYFLFQETGAGKRMSFLGAALLASTPFYFIMANSFLTDVPFYALMIPAFLFLVRYLKHERNTDLALGILFGSLAVLVRQLGLFIPLAFGIAYLTKRGIRIKTILISLLVYGSIAAVLTFYHETLKNTVGIPYMDVVKSRVAPGIVHMIQHGEASRFAFAFYFRLLAVFIYLGIFLLPALTLTAPGAFQTFSRKDKIYRCFLFAAFFLTASLTLWHHQKLLPLLGVYINSFGVGPVTISGGEFLAPLPSSVWFPVTAVGVLGGSVLFSLIVGAASDFLSDLFTRREVSRHWPAVFSLSACFIHFVPFGFTGHFDRYQACYIPFLLFFLFSLPSNSRPVFFPRTRAVLSWGFIFLIGAFSIAGTKDYFSWNEARWKGLTYLMNHDGVSPAEIDGGYEFNGWFLYDPNYAVVPGRSWWWVNDDKYVVSFGPKPGYEILHSIPYKQRISRTAGVVLVLKRIQENVTRDFSQARSVYQIS